MSQTRSGKTYNPYNQQNNTNNENPNLDKNMSQNDTMDTNTEKTPPNEANSTNTTSATPTPSQTNSETQVTIPVVRQTTPPNQQVPAPRVANYWEFLDPTIPMRVKLLKNVNIQSIILPQSHADLLNEHFVSYPEGMRFLMMGVQIPGVTQLDENAITETFGEVTYITPYEAKDHEWLHLVLKHPRDDKHNRWRTQLIPTPNISSFLILKALHLFQIYYVLYAINPKGTVTSEEVLGDVRRQWRRLPEPVQQWILQLLAIRPDDPTTQLLASHGLIRAQDTTTVDAFFAQLGAMDYIFQTSEYWAVANTDDYKRLPLQPWEAQVHDIELTKQQLKQVKHNRAMGIGAAQTDEQKANDETMTPIIKTPVMPRNREPTVREARAFHRYKAQTRYYAQQGPPPVLPAYQPSHNVLYWDKETEEHRTLQWRFEYSWAKVSHEGTANNAVYNSVLAQVHAKDLVYINQMVEALSVPKQQETQAYGPSRGQTKKPTKSTNPYTPPPTTPQGATTARRPRRPNDVNTNATANTNATNANKTPGNATAPQQGLPNGITPIHDEQKQPPSQQGTQTQQQRVRFDLTKNQTNYYSQYAQQINPTLTQQPMYSNPTTSEQLASNIANAFSNGTLPPRQHDTMPQAPTGTVQTPAPANTPVETRYQAIPPQPFANFSMTQLNSIDQVLGQYGQGISSSTKRQYSQPSHINTSLASIPSIHSIHTMCP